MAPFSSPLLNEVLDVLACSKVDLSDAATVCSAGKAAAHEYEALDTIAGRNEYIVGIVRAVCASHGLFAGWECLARIASNVRFPSAVLADVVRGIHICDTLRPAAHQKGTPTGLHAVITSSAQRDSIEEVSPKTLGGRSWMESDDYAAVLRTWSSSGFAPIGPTTAFAFLGVQRKAIYPRADIDDCDAMMLLGSLLDYDFDRVEDYTPGFAQAMAIAMRYVAETGSPMQGMALLALVNCDVQQHNRAAHERWVQGGMGSLVEGADCMPAQDVVALMLTDCGTLGVFGYEPADSYADSRSGMFCCMVVGGIYDLLYDRAISSLAAPTMYVAAAGMAKHDMHCIFVTTVLDAIAKRISGSSDVTIPLLGDNALLVTAAWAPFNVRYHTWERFVKYSRQIACSTTSEVHRVAELAHTSAILPDCNLADIDDLWRRTTTRGAEATMVPRRTTRYIPGAAPEIAEITPPDICASCLQSFTEALDASETHEIHAIEGMPPSVIKSQAVAMAAAIYRAALYASGSACCEVCACRIGCWADVASTEVMLALMRTERKTSAREWLLQCYVAACVPVAPVSVPSILSGFDVLCEVTQHEGAMGSRDILDC